MTENFVREEVTMLRRIDWRTTYKSTMMTFAAALLALPGGATGYWLGDHYGGPEGGLATLTLGFGVGLALGFIYGLRTCLWIAVAIGLLFAAVGILDDLMELGLFWDRGWLRVAIIAAALAVGIGGATAAGAAISIGLRWVVRKGRSLLHRPANATRPVS